MEHQNFQNCCQIVFKLFQYYYFRLTSRTVDFKRAEKNLIYKTAIYRNPILILSYVTSLRNIAAQPGSGFLNYKCFLFYKNFQAQALPSF